MTHQRPAIEALSAAGVFPPASISNAEGGPLMRSPEGPEPDGPLGRVAGSLCAEGTRPRPRLAVQAIRLRRGCSWIDDRP